MKEYYELKKVVDPHQHMPKKIRSDLLEGLRHQELNNDTFVRWTVGEYKSEYEASLEEEEEDEESDSEELEYEDEEDEYDDYGSYDYEENLPRLAKVDEFLLKHFKKGEELIILYWW